MPQLDFSEIQNVPEEILLSGPEKYPFQTALQPIFKYKEDAVDKNLLFLPPGGLLSSMYARLINVMKAECSVYIVENLEFITEKTYNFQSLVQYYLRLIQSVQLDGPIYLAGWSRGSILAHAVAEQLQETSKDVAGLFLIDPMGYTMTPDQINTIYSDPRVADLPAEHKTSLHYILYHYWCSYALAAKPYSGKVIHFRSKSDFLTSNNGEDAREIFYGERFEFKTRVLDLIDDYYNFVEDTSRSDKKLGGLESVFNDYRVVHLHGNHYECISRDNIRVVAEHIDACLV